MKFIKKYKLTLYKKEKSQVYENGFYYSPADNCYFFKNKKDALRFLSDAICKFPKIDLIADITEVEFIEEAVDYLDGEAG